MNIGKNKYKMHNNFLKQDEIEELYNKFVKVNHTDEYKHRYEPLPLHKNNKKWRWEDKDFPRVISLLEFERYIQKYNFQINKLLVFDGENDPEVEYLNNRYKQILDIKFTNNSQKYDLHNLQINHRDFDFVLLNQTLEHIYDPFLCLTNIKKYMSKDGLLYINVPICNVPHSDPLHFYTGYTLMGLLSICKLCDFEILEAGQWGNEEYLTKLWTRDPGWSDFRQLKNPGLNQIENPVIAWCLIKNKG